jgi:hypothetical protein
MAAGGLVKTSAALPFARAAGLFRKPKDPCWYAGLAFAVAVALCLVAHCHYVFKPPKRLEWFALWLGLSVLLTVPCRWLVNRVVSQLQRHVIYPLIGGLLLAVWWNGQIFDNLWLHAKALQSVLGVFVFVAHTLTFALLLGALWTGLAKLEAPAKSQAERGSFRWPVRNLVLFLLAANALAAWYVSQERTIYFCDFMGYWTWSADWAELCLRDPAAGWERFRISVQSAGYGLLPSLGPASAIAMFGDHRLVYVLAVVNLYLGATFLAVWAFVNRYVPGGRTGVLVAVILFGMPLVWWPILRGYLDLGGAAFAVLSLVVYLRRPQGMLHATDLIAVAALLAGAVLFRRWYSFWVVAFGAVIAAEAAIAFVVALRTEPQIAWRRLVPPVLVGGLTGIVLCLAAWPMVLHVAQADYADAYAAYRSPFTLAVRLGNLGSLIGWPYIAVSAAATIALAFSPTLRRPALLSVATGPVIVAHFLRTQDFNPHHTYLLLPSLVLPPLLVLAALFARWPGWAASLGIGSVLAAGLVGLAPQLDSRADGVRIYTGRITPAADCRPLQRGDLDEWRRMLRFLSAETERTGERIAIVSSSPTFDPTMMLSAGRSLREPFPALERCEEPWGVDRVAGFPNGLFRAGLVLVADPPQTHLDPGEQQTILLPARQLLDGTGIGQAFDRLPESFALDSGVTVLVFRRARPVNADAFATFQADLQHAHASRPHVFTPSKEASAAALESPPVGSR